MHFLPTNHFKHNKGKICSWSLMFLIFCWVWSEAMDSTWLWETPWHHICLMLPPLLTTEEQVMDLVDTISSGKVYLRTVLSGDWKPCADMADCCVVWAQLSAQLAGSIWSNGHIHDRKQPMGHPRYIYCSCDVWKPPQEYSVDLSSWHRSVNDHSEKLYFVKGASGGQTVEAWDVSEPINITDHIQTNLFEFMSKSIFV